jgi:hypothetical protein
MRLAFRGATEKHVGQRMVNRSASWRCRVSKVMQRAVVHKRCGPVRRLGGGLGGPDGLTSALRRV